MPKKKYLYKDKKFISGKNLESEDFLSYISPSLAKKMSANYISDRAQMEKFFELYFDSLRELGISDFLNPRKIRQDADILRIYSDEETGYLEKNIYAVTFPDKEIFIRGNSKTGDYETIFHELNHVFAFHNYSKKAPTYEERGPLQTNQPIENKTGFNVDYVGGGEEFLYFNEGVTEYLALRQGAYVSKKERPISVYDFGVAFARMLYLVAGNALFDGYFNGGNFETVTRGIGIEGLTKELVKEFADAVSLIADEISDEDEIVGILEYSYETIIQILGLKVEKEICENFDKFKNSDEIVACAIKAYANFSEAIYFGSSRFDYTNIIRNEVFNMFYDNYIETLYAIEQRYFEEGMHIKFDSDLKISDNEINSALTLFNMINLKNYGLISNNEKPITIDNLLSQENITVMNQGKANYIRKKSKAMDDPFFMRAYGEHYEHMLDK